MPDSPCGPRPPHCWGSLVTHRQTAHGRTLLGEWWARRRDLYLTTHTHKRHAPGGIRTSNPRERTAVNEPLRPRCQWVRSGPYPGLQYMESVYIFTSHLRRILMLYSSVLVNLRNTLPFAGLLLDCNFVCISGLSYRHLIQRFMCIHSAAEIVTEPCHVSGC
jgi:hypothetical protein